MPIDNPDCHKMIRGELNNWKAAKECGFLSSLQLSLSMFLFPTQGEFWRGPLLGQVRFHWFLSCGWGPGGGRRETQIMTSTSLWLSGIQGLGFASTGGRGFSPREAYTEAFQSLGQSFLICKMLTPTNSNGHWRDYRSWASNRKFRVSHRIIVL